MKTNKILIAILLVLFLVALSVLCQQYHMKKYEEFCNKYETFRAKCVENVANCEMPLTLKAEAFKKCNEYYEEKECVIIPLKLAQSFSEYAKTKGIVMDKLEYYEDLLKNKRSSEKYLNSPKKRHLKKRIENEKTERR